MGIILKPGLIYPKFLTGGSNEVNAEIYKHTPEYLALMVSDNVNVLTEKIDRLENTEVNLCETLEEIFVHISDQGMLDNALVILEDSIKQLYYSHGELKDGNTLSKAMCVFAGAVANELSIIKAYDNNGNLPYRFSHLDACDNVILKKCLDFV